jgi:hypothetical protein
MGRTRTLQSITHFSETAAAGPYTSDQSTRAIAAASLPPSAPGLCVEWLCVEWPCEGIDHGNAIYHREFNH